MDVNKERLRLLGILEPERSGSPAAEAGPKPWLEFDEAGLRADRLAREQGRQQQSLELLARLSLDIDTRWTELAADAGGASVLDIAAAEVMGRPRG